MGNYKIIDIAQERLDLGSLGSRLFTGGLIVGVLGMLASVGYAMGVEGSWERFSWSYLVNWLFFLSIAIGGLFWLLVQNITRAAWSVAVRRPLEGITGALPWMVIFGIPVVLMSHTLYFWTHADVRANDPLVIAKLAYLNEPFFYARVAVYFVSWIFAVLYLRRLSVAQDQDGDPERTLRSERFSIVMMFVFAITVTFAAFDFVMALDAHWFSTIFGIYFFAGCALGAMSFLAFLLWFLQSRGFIENAVSKEHYHDVGKFMFGFVIFWAYIAFSQFMLIWYAHIPEETGWYLRRMEGFFGQLGIVLIFGHFFLPFLALISRVPKRRKGLLAIAGLYLLAVHWIDIYWLVMPEMASHGASHAAEHGHAFGVQDFTLLIGFGGLFVAAVARTLSSTKLIAVKDPRLAESLTFENA